MEKRKCKGRERKMDEKIKTVCNIRRKDGDKKEKKGKR